MKKILILILLSSISLGATRLKASSYNYDYYGYRESAEGYTVESTIYAENILDNTRFMSLEEIQVKNGYIYLLDSKNDTNEIAAKNNSRLFVFNEEFTLQYTINSFFEFKDVAYPEVENDTSLGISTLTAEEQEAVNNVIKLINDLPEEVTLEDRGIYGEIENAYDALGNNKSYVTNARKLLYGVSLFKAYDNQDYALNPTEKKVFGKEKVRQYFNSAKGFCVTKDRIYMADTENERIVVLHLDGELDFIITTPEDDTFNEEVKFKPLKVSVDSGKRIYVIAQNVFQGIIQLNKFGKFELYTGVNKVSVSPLEALWRKFYTEEQLSRIQLYLPREFTNLVIDDKNFIYVTAKPTKNSTDALIKCINPSGKDILKQNGYVPVIGDNIYVESTGTLKVPTGRSNFVSIDVNEYGLYSALDSKRGRIFTYNKEGHLLYISGHLGEQNDALGTPVSIKYLNNDLLVVDQKTNSVIIYKETATGKLINEASELHRNGYFKEAASKWLRVIELNSNYQMAYNHIGKLILNDEDNEIMKLLDPSFNNDEKLKYQTAMKYFDLGKDPDYYSEAYKQYRTLVIKDNFDWIMTVGVIGIIIALGVTITLRYKKKEKGESEL